MPICGSCGARTRKKDMCHPCAVTYSNRRMTAQGKGKLAPKARKHWINIRQANIDLDRQLRGLPKDKVPIAKVRWLERPMP